MTRSPRKRISSLCPQAAALVGLLVLAGCQARDTVPQASFSAAGKQVISDAAHNDGTPGFYFLPPTVPSPGAFGSFRPDIYPRVQIDRVLLSPDGCTSDCTATVAQSRVAYWTRWWGSDYRHIRVHINRSCDQWRSWQDDDDDSDGDDDVPEGYFVVRWDSDDFGVALHGIYRIRVMVPSNGGMLELGYADIEIVANKKQYRKVDQSDYIPLIDGRSLKIKFRIDTPALACVNVSCPPAADGSAVACDPHIGQCPNPLPAAGSPCADDGNPCTTDLFDGAGACVHAAGNAGTQCGAADGPCGLPAVCDGLNSACPANPVKAAGTVCRDATDACDEPATCDGQTSACPANPVKAAGTLCRDATGPCEQPASCNGESSACPANALVSAGTVCRASAGACDAEETCTGSSAACPDDAKVASGTLCRSAQGDCDMPASCDGSTNDCPANGYKPASTVCRPSAGACDVAETCTGSSATCPADALAAAGTLCRGSNGQCDVAETCDGATAACPVDAFQPDGMACTLPVCTAALVCHQGGCVPSLTQCAPGYNDDGTGTCVPSGAQSCQVDDFDGTALDPHWNLTQVGAPPPGYAVAGSHLLISDAALADTPSFGGSWIFQANVDLGNQIGWAQPIGTNDFDVEFSFAWDWQNRLAPDLPDALLAGVGLTNAANQLEVRAGIAGPADVPFPLALVRNGSGTDGQDDGFVGDSLANGTARMRLVRAGGVLTIEVDGQTVWCQPFAADIRNVVIFTAKAEFQNIEYPFGEFDLDSVQVCRPTLTCAQGYADAGNGRCERVPQ